MYKMNKLFELQKRLQPIKKDLTNPFHNSRYFDINKLLDYLKPIFTEMDILLTQPLKVVDGKSCLYTYLINQSDSTVILETSIIIPEISDPQKIGSCITYLRRYSLQTALGLEAEDDDANVASGHTQAKTYAPVDTSEMVKLKTNWIEDPIKRREQNDKIKSVGGKWNADEKSWYVPKNVTLQDNE